MYKLYGVVRSRASRVMWMMEELGLTYEQVAIEPNGTSNRAPEYLAVNPAGKVPVLADGDFKMSESQAILLWLAQGAGAPLWPKDRQEQGRVLQWVLWTAAEVEPVTSAILKGLRDPSPGAAEQVAQLRKQASELMRLIELQLSSTAYIAAPSFTVADVSIGSNLAYAEAFGIDLAPYPKLRAWRQLLQARPAYQRVFGPPK